MSDFICPVVQIGKIGKHPNADTLSITQVEGCPCIFRTVDFNEGDLAIYIPVESLVTKGWPALDFLKWRDDNTYRVKAAKLRGIFSMGILIPPSPATHVSVGTDMKDVIGVKKYEETGFHVGTGNVPDPHIAPTYDLEPYRKYKGLLIPEEVIVVTEKIHGCNSRFAVHAGPDGIPEFFAGSHSMWKKEDDDCLWWKVAKRYNLKEKLSKIPEYVLFGETYGWVQDIRYGMKQGDFAFAAFDIMQVNSRRFLNPVEFKTLCESLEIPMVPLIYSGPYSDEKIQSIVGGKSQIADCIKEGIVIKPLEERVDQHIGRVALKLHSEEYLLRKNGTEAK